MTLFNRRQVPDDFLSQTNEVRDERRDVPETSILDEPLLCLQFNEDWFPHIIGAVNTLANWTAWNGNDDDTNDGSRAIRDMLSQDFTCGTSEPCTIEELLADEEFFNTEYVPQTFGAWYTETQSHNDDLNTAYDGTPQSIGADIPTGTPDDLEDNALCYALHSFVKLYSSGKTCIIQSKNFLEIEWNKLQSEAANFYNEAVNRMGYVWLPDIYACFVDDDEAIIALADTAAIEELACYLFDALSVVTMSRANFDDAISDATTALTGNAQKIACIMDNDNNLDLYINFLEGYQIALIRINNGETLDCPCVSATYQIYTQDFANGMGVWTIPWSGATKLGVYSGGRVEGVDRGSNRYLQVNWEDFNPAWRVKAVRITLERVNGSGNGTYDTENFLLRPTPNSNTGSFAPINASFQPNGIDTPCGAMTTGVNYWTGINQLAMSLSVSDNAGAHIYLDKIEIQFWSSHSYGGYFTADTNMCV